MLFYLPTLYHYVIYVGLHIPSNLRLERPRHHSLIRGSYILEAKGHHPIVVVPIRSTKSCLLLII